MIPIALYAHQFFLGKDYRDKIVVDMTSGTGRDTLFLASLCPNVIAFDIQASAIEQTKALLDIHHLSHVQLIQDDHQRIDHYCQSPIYAAIYNLGYLPGGNKSVKTSEQATIASLSKLLGLLEVGGFIILVVYQRHPGNESQALIRFVENLPGNAIDVLKHSVLNKELAPYVIEIRKLSSFITVRTSP